MSEILDTSPSPPPRDRLERLQHEAVKLVRDMAELKRCLRVVEAAIRREVAARESRVAQAGIIAAWEVMKRPLRQRERRETS